MAPEPPLPPTHTCAEICSMDARLWTLVQLKQYLRERRVPHSGYNKQQLLKLVENSLKNPELLQSVDSDDGEEVGVIRRTISVKGQLVAFPDPHLLRGWSDTLSNIPKITSGCCLMFLMKKGWSTKRLHNFEKERGYQLFNDKHINCVELKQVEHEMLYIRGKCIRQTAQKESPYTVWLLATSDGEIKASGCQCTG